MLQGEPVMLIDDVSHDTEEALRRSQKYMTAQNFNRPGDDLIYSTDQITSQIQPTTTQRSQMEQADFSLSEATKTLNSGDEIVQTVDNSMFDKQYAPDIPVVTQASAQRGFYYGDQADEVKSRDFDLIYNASANSQQLREMVEDMPNKRQEKTEQTRRQNLFSFGADKNAGGVSGVDSSHELVSADSSMVNVAETLDQFSGQKKMRKLQ